MLDVQYDGKANDAARYRFWVWVCAVEFILVDGSDGECGDAKGVPAASTARELRTTMYMSRTAWTTSTG